MSDHYPLTRFQVHALRVVAETFGTPKISIPREGLIALIEMAEACRPPGCTHCGTELSLASKTVLVVDVPNAPRKRFCDSKCMGDYTERNCIPIARAEFSGTAVLKSSVVFGG